MNLMCPSCTNPPPENLRLPCPRCEAPLHPFLTHGACPGCGTTIDALRCKECMRSADLVLWFGDDRASASRFRLFHGLSEIHEKALFMLRHASEKPAHTGRIRGMAGRYNVLRVTLTYRACGKLRSRSFPVKLLRNMREYLVARHLSDPTSFPKGNEWYIPTEDFRRFVRIMELQAEKAVRAARILKGQPLVTWQASPDEIIRAVKSLKAISRQRRFDSADIYLRFENNHEAIRRRPDTSQEQYPDAECGVSAIALVSVQGDMSDPESLAQLTVPEMAVQHGSEILLDVFETMQRSSEPGVFQVNLAAAVFSHRILAECRFQVKDFLVYADDLLDHFEYREQFEQCERVLRLKTAICDHQATAN